MADELPSLSGLVSKPPSAATKERKIVLELRDIDVHFGDRRIIRSLSMVIREGVTAIFGPSGSGKTVLLRTMSGLIFDDPELSARVTGELLLFGQRFGFASNDYRQTLRKRVTYVPTRAHPFPGSIRRNIEVVAEESGRASRPSELEKIVVDCLKRVALWDEVRDRLDDSAAHLSMGQNQRLCIARALALRPDVLVLDEPAAFLDVIACQRIEEMVYESTRDMAIVVVTHSMYQAARIANASAFLWGVGSGSLVEFDETEKMFTAPAEKLTEDYVTGRFG